MKICKKKHVIIHVAKHPMSGLWSSIKTMLKGQEALDEHIISVAIFAKKSWPQQYKNELKEFAYKPHCSYIGDFPMSYITLMFWHNLKKHVDKLEKEFHPERIILHFHNSDFSSIFLRRWMKQARYRLVVTFHGMPGIDQKFARRRPWQKFLFDRLVSYHAKLLSTDKYGIDQAVDVLGYRRSDFLDYVIPNGLVPSPRPFKIKKEYPEMKLCFVGNLDDNKGWEIIIDAVELAHNTGVHLILNIAGTGPLREKLSQMISDKTEYIKYHGQLNNARESITAKSDILMQASKIEGVSMVCLEAMSEGLAVISPEVGAVSEIVTNGAGIMIVERNKDSIAKAIQQLWKDPDYLNRLKENNRTCFEMHYDIASVSRRLFQLYTADD